MDGFYKGRRVQEYRTMGDFTKGQNFVQHLLPHPWAGTGHVVYNGSLYYNKHQSNILVGDPLRRNRSAASCPLAAVSQFRVRIFPRMRPPSAEGSLGGRTQACLPGNRVEQCSLRRISWLHQHRFPNVTSLLLVIFLVIFYHQSYWR